MREKIYRKITSILTKWWLAVLIVATLLVIFCYPYTKSLFGNISTDLIKLLPQDYTSVKLLERMRDKFKAKNTLSVVIESDNPEKTKELLVFLADKFKNDPKVEKAQYKKTGYDFFDKHKLLFLELEDLKTIKERVDRRIQRGKLGGFYINFEDESDDKDNEFTFGDLEQKYKTKYTKGTRSKFLTDDEEKVYVVFLTPSDNDDGLTAYKRFYEHIRSGVESIDVKEFDPSMQVYYSSTIRNRISEYDALIKDLKLAGIISGFGIFLLLTLYFRRILAAVIVFIPLSAGIIYSFAFAFIFIKNLNVVTSFLFAVLGGLGVEVGIHMFARYNEERAAGKDVSESVFTILFHTGRAAITAGIIVASTFLILIINDFKGFSEFGLITGSGILIVYLTYHILFPPLLIAFEKMRLLKFKKIEEIDESKIKETKFPASKIVLATTVVLLAFSVAGLFNVGFEYNFGKLKAQNPETELARTKHESTTSSLNRPAAVIIENLDEALAVKEVIQKQIAKDEENGIEPVIDRYKSWYDIVQYNQDEKLEVIEDIKTLLNDHTIKLVKGEKKKDLDKFKEELNATTPIEESEIPPEVKEIFFGKANDGYQISFINANPTLELDNGRNAIAFAERIENIETPIGTFHASSDSVVFADVLRTMLSDVPRVVILSIICIFLFVFLDFRNFKKTLLITSPILLGVVLMFGLMYILKMKLNFFNMIVIPTVFGTSIDNSIHIYHRFEEMGKKSLMKVIKTSGSAALMSSLTNILGFLGLVFANHQGLASIGKLAIVGMSTCLFTTLVYFPALLQILFAKK